MDTYAKRLLAVPQYYGRITLPRFRYPAHAPIAKLTPESPAVSYDPKSQLWTLESDLTVTVDDYTFFVAKGFRTDLASVPRACWWAIAPFELSVAAPIVHDYLYDYGYIELAETFSGVHVRHTFAKADADRFLRDIALQEGVPSWRAHVSYVAVKLFGKYTPHRGQP